MMNFPFGIGAHPVYTIDTPEEAVFWAGIKEARRIKNAEKEKPTMKVSYNGFTGGLVKLEASGLCYDENRNPFQGYTLKIRDCEKKAIISFDLVKLEDLKFLGGAVSFQ